MKMKKFFSAVLILGVLVSAVSVRALAGDEAAGEPGSAETGYDFIVNGFDCTYYNNDGRIVFNNYGTVYNNGNCGVVYNNGGTVYNNGGTVYNNCGTVYNNSGTAFNNCGEVVNGPEGIVVDNTAAPAIEPEEAAPTEKKADGSEESIPETDEDFETEEIPEAAEPLTEGIYKISLAADYSRFAYIEGSDKSGLDYTVTGESEITVTAKPGYSLLSSFATTGCCTLQEDGSIVFSGAERDGTLSLAFRADEPVIVPKFGTYGETVSVKIIAADGVTVYYTTDGSPVSEESAVYDSPIEISTSSPLEVMAAAEGAENSRVFSGYYLIPSIKAPRFESLKKGYEPVRPQPITVENTGIERLKIESVKLTGIDANCFVLNTEEGERIDPGQSSKDTWTVAPVSALNTGTYEAAVEFTFADGNTAAVDLSFTVTK